MKSNKQVLVLLIVVAAGVFLLSFLSQLSPSRVTPETDIPAPTQEKLARLNFPFTEAPWGSDHAPDFELLVPGSYAFWFENDQEWPVQFGLITKSCKCTHVDVCLLPREQAVRTLAAAAVLQTASLFGSPAFVQDFLDRWPTDSSLPWQPLTTENAKGVEAPPRSMGWIRVAWAKDKGAKPQLERLGVDVWMQNQYTGSRLRLEVAVNLVEPIRAAEHNLSVGQFDQQRSRGDVNVFVRSSTRTQFPLTADAGGDPFVSLGNRRR